MNKKHVLIVDDAKDLLFLITHSVKRLGPEYEITTATSGQMALEKIQNQKFDLVLTDYMMGSMTGLDLAQEVKKISPETQVILMSAYDTKSLRQMVKDMDLTGYLGKPFTIPKVLEIVEQAIAHTHPTSATTSVADTPEDTTQKINKALKTLYHKTGAHYALLLDSRGHPVQVVGRTENATLSRIATFVAANFLAVTELASLLGDNSSVFRSSYHEGSNYNIYAHDINGEYLLAVVFGTKDKPGTVWFYTKKAVEAIAPLLGQSSSGDPINDAAQELVEHFHNLLGDEGRSTIQPDTPVQ